MIFISFMIFKSVVVINNHNKMSSSDLKKRLQSLRHLTQDLRHSSMAPHANLNHIQNILHNLKDISQSKPSSSPPKYNRPQSRQSRQPNYHSEQREHEKSNRSFYPYRSKEESAHQKQIIALREQNLRLEEKVSLLRQELSNRKVQPEIKKETNEATLPYFRHNQTLQIFVCRFDIAKSQYDKIQYNHSKVQLHLDRLLITDSNRGILQQFDLTTLKYVDYLHTNAILYQLEEFIKEEHQPLSLEPGHHPTLTNIFVKFDSFDQKHKWDLSIFHNYQLSTSLKVPKLFEKHFQRIKNQESIRKETSLIKCIKDSKEIGLQLQKELLAVYLQKKEEYVAIKNLVQEKIPFQQSQDKIELSSVKVKRYSNETEKNTLSGAIQEDLPDKKEGINRRPSQFSIGSSKERNSNRESKEKLSQRLSKQRNSKSEEDHEQKPISVQQQLIEKKPESKFRQHRFSFSNKDQDPSLNFQNFQAVSPRNNMSLQNQISLFSQANVPTSRQNTAAMYSSASPKPLNFQPLETRPLSIVQNKVTIARKSLQEGFAVTKYSKDGVFFHQKKIYLSLDCKKLCWCQKDKQSEYKSIPLEVITKIQYGVLGQGIKKHIRKPNPLNYCVIEYYTGQYKKKTIELGSTPQIIRQCCQDLQIILNYNRGLSLTTLVQS